MEKCRCGNPFHPATGFRLSEKTVLCGPCTKSFHKFYLNQMKRANKGGFRLADAAETSIRAQ